jgi:peptide/nickel transport system ATP-binding protein
MQPLMIHRGLSRSAARKRAIELLDLVGIPAPDDAVDRYPHQMSGGQRQRVMIASAIACEPKLLIADEPTTALDVTVQAQVLALIADLRKKMGLACLLITHDLGVVNAVCDRAYVMQAGRIVEEGSLPALFTAPKHDYTRALLRANLATGAPAAAKPVAVETAAPLLQVETLTKLFGDTSGHKVIATDNVSFDLHAGEVLGIVGESGSGKTTLARMIMRLVDPTFGRILLNGEDFAALRGSALKAARRNIQMVFQDPYSSLNPRHKIGEVIAEPLRVHGLGDSAWIDARVLALLEMVGLPADAVSRYPHEFSGGQRQRIAIARAIAVEPKLIVADEPVSSLDVSIQSQILKLIAELRARLGLSMIFISHDLGVVRHVSDRIAVMKDGAIVEIGSAADVFDRPQHAYTRALLASIPKLPGVVYA